MTVSAIGVIRVLYGWNNFYRFFCRIERGKKVDEKIAEEINIDRVEHLASTTYLDLPLHHCLR